MRTSSGMWLLLVLAAASATAVGPPGRDASTRPAAASRAPMPPAVDPFAGADRFHRTDALPGVVVLSDGRMLAGRIHTTRDRDWEVWVESAKRWRHIPPAAVLSIRAVVVAEQMEQEWRWKEMGSDEKVFTGRTRPTRRFRWRFRLADGSSISGDVKGQPLWVESSGKRHGPFVLHERSAGAYGQSLRELVHVKYVVISARAMRQVLQARAAASKPAC